MRPTWENSCLAATRALRVGRGKLVAIRGFLSLVSTMVAAAPALAQAEPEPLPDYATCMAEAVAHFEMEFFRTGVAETDADFTIMTRRRVEYCGTIGIVLCDRSGQPFECQAELAREQEALRAAILASLPAPEAVAGQGYAAWSEGLYPTLWAVAHGSSAGPDCAGSDPAMEAWCITREASLKVTEAISLWQLARLLGVAGPAVEAGWIDAPPPPRPVPRPERR
jgi:hypothetical protein